jgi:hypothetical protein
MRVGGDGGLLGLMKVDIQRLLPEKPFFRPLSQGIWKAVLVFWMIYLLF